MNTLFFFHSHIPQRPCNWYLVDCIKCDPRDQLRRQQGRGASARQMDVLQRLRIAYALAHSLADWPNHELLSPRDDVHHDAGRASVLIALFVDDEGTRVQQTRRWKREGEMETEGGDKHRAGVCVCVCHS